MYVFTIGKSTRNPIVMAFLMPNCTQALNKILQARTKFKGLSNNKFMFATYGDRKHHVKGYDAIKNVVKLSGASATKGFTAANLRKYITTEMVWLNVSDTTRKL